MNSILIKRKSIIYWILYLTLFSELIISFIPSFSFIRYLSDVLLLLCLITSFKSKSCQKKYKYSAITPIIIYFIFVSLSALFNRVDLLLYLWAIRNTFRFLLFYSLCLLNLDEHDVKKITDFLIKLQYFNFVVVLIEFFVLGYKRDYLGGIFGIEQGCNGPLNIYLVLVTCIALGKYFLHNKSRNSIHELILTILISIIIAAISELKFFFVELLILLLFVFLIYKFSMRKLYTFLILLLLFIVGIKVMINVFPEQITFFSNFEEVEKYINMTGDNNNTIIGRGTFFNQINTLFFQDNTLYKVFGLGFGATEMSSNINALNSDFYYKYGDYGYRNISSAMIYLESGLVGLILYISIFLIIAFKAFKKRNETILYDYSKIICLFSIIMIFNIFYNSVCRRDVSYLSFMVLSFLPILLNRKEDEVNE